MSTCTVFDTCALSFGISALKPHVVTQEKTCQAHLVIRCVNMLARLLEHIALLERGSESRRWHHIQVRLKLAAISAQRWLVLCRRQLLTSSSHMSAGRWQSGHLDC